MARVSGLGIALCCVAVLTAAPATEAGHEVSYYPSFYPQEIRIEPLDPQAAAREFLSKTDPLHAYIGAAPRFAGEAPMHLKSVVSLRSYITASVDPKSARAQSRDARCGALAHAAAGLAKEPDTVAHPYPVTPYHADYLGHADRLHGAAKQASASLPDAGGPALAIHDVQVDELLRKAGVGSNIWVSSPWAKEGWFQAYHLLRAALSDKAQGERADALYERLTLGRFKDLAERLGAGRELVAALTQSCERGVIGYRLRRETYSDEFSNGIENIASDSQFGLNSPIVVRTVKLKDFPWNGWLRLGIGTTATAAWNPVAGFSDAAGRLVWAAIGDDAFLPVTYASHWVQNRAEILADEEERKPAQSALVPADALMPQAGTGKLVAVGSGKGAAGKVSYRLAASAFHDGTEMEAADLVYPFALAFRWGEKGASGSTYDPDIAASTKLLRERLAGVRIVRVEERALQLADLTFNYRMPIAEVYLNALSSTEEENGLTAPPWSSVPWHVLALMEAAVERKIAAFSQGEAARQGVPWLDLARDKGQLAKMAALIEEFARSGHRPAALESLVSADAARARWQALGKFFGESGHLLVTNGPYRLASHAPGVYVFNVVREFTYPIGIGTFDPFAYPPRAIITALERAGDRVLIAVDAEIAVKQQRDRRIYRKPLTRETMREVYPIRPVATYVMVGSDGKLAAAGHATWEADGRFAAAVPALSPGSYELFTGVFLDGNTIDPSVSSISFESK